MDLRFEFQTAGCRRLWALISGLPLDCAIRRDGKTWTTERELIARQVEQQASLLRLIAEALGVKFKSPPPEPIHHPDRVTKPVAGSETMAKPNQIRQFIARMRG